MRGETFIGGPRPPATGASREAIQDHYDIGDAFYALWLDENMQYSSAMWEPGDTLENAQVRKLDYHLDQARADGSRRVLDVGCGWGGLLRRAIGRRGVACGVGLTLSAAQAEYAAALGTPGVDVRLENWRDHVPSAPYDGIVSIGAFEHFARLEFSEAQKVAAYRGFFRWCHRHLRTDGYLSLQTFAYGNMRSREEARSTPATQFLANAIFRETDPPRLANIAEATEGTFDIVSLRNDRHDYAQTCRVWLQRLRARRAMAVDIVGEDVVERYERYLTYAFIGFETGNLALFRITLRRLRTQTPE
ncbi:class I SAM-dependent methyltransferase [Pendulispora albinea]|uniref:Cyclopropane-fatty-acyl-phospholipid synthase family protein n=1 Tax=Pendulispora albinea TaxID=2741071 RepID=A0ABZ2LMK8_9BACT